MSFNPWWWVERYARWRENYLEENPDKRLFSWIFGGIKSIPRPEEPIVTLGEKGKKIGILLLLGLVLLASSGE